MSDLRSVFYSCRISHLVAYLTSNKIDDEIHLLLHCNARYNEQEILFNSVAARYIVSGTITSHLLLNYSYYHDFVI